MDPLPLKQPEIMVRYGRLAPNARDRVLDQFYLTYSTTPSLRSYFRSRAISLAAGLIALIMICIAILFLVVDFLKLQGEFWPIALAMTIAVQAAWLACMLSASRKTRYKGSLLQPTELGLTPVRINQHARSIFGGIVSSSIRWEDVSSVRVADEEVKTSAKQFRPLSIHPATPGASSISSQHRPYLEIRDTGGQCLKLFFDCIQTIEERQILKEFLVRYVRQVDVSDAARLLLRTGATDIVPFTKLWSRALQDTSRRKNTAPLPIDSLLQGGRFVINGCMGGGGQATIYSCEMRESNQDEKVVLKEYVLPDIEHTAQRKAAAEQFEKEIRLLNTIDHAGVIKVLDAFVEDHRAYLVLEYVESISLKEYVQRAGPINERRVVDLALQLCDILDYLHNMKPAIMHLDLSPENILLSKSNKVTLIDFSISAEENSLRTRTVMGKQHYMAPEQYRGKPTVQSDIYSLGATLFYLLTGREPEPISVAKPLKYAPGTAPELDAILSRATQLEESQRFQSIAELRQALATLSDALPQQGGAISVEEQLVADEQIGSGGNEESGLDETAKLHVSEAILAFAEGGDSEMRMHCASQHEISGKQLHLRETDRQ